MADQIVGVQNLSGAGTSNVDVAELTVNAKTVERQRVAIGDNTTPANYLAIAADGSLNAETVANTTGGASTYSAVGGTGNALLTNSAVAAATGVHNLYAVAFWNPNTVDIFVQVFDVAHASVTLGTTVPKLVFRVPAGNGVQAGSWEQRFAGESKIAFATEIALAATTTATGSTAPTTGVHAAVVYK